MSLRRPMVRMLLVVPLASIVIAGCAGFGVEEKRRLDEVRQQLADAEREPAVQAHAASFLAIAAATLREARAADDPAEARHLIYLAQRRVEIARSVAGLKLAAARLETLPAKSRTMAGAPRPTGTQNKGSDGEIVRGKDTPDRRTATGPGLRTAELAFSAARAPVPPRRPKTGPAAGRDQQASLPETGQPATGGRGGGEERLWRVLPMDSLFADLELLRLAASVERDLAPLVRFLRENEDSIVLIKGNLVKDKPTEKELAWSVHAAEAIKEHLVDADIESNRIFTIGRIEAAAAPARKTGKRNVPVGRVEIALFDGGSPASP